MISRRGPFYKYVLILIPEQIRNYTHYKLKHEITYPFPNFNGFTVEVWEWMSKSSDNLQGGKWLLVHARDWS